MNKYLAQINKSCWSCPKNALWTKKLCKSFKEVFGLRDAKDFGCGVEAIKPRYTEGSDLTGFPALG